MKYLLNFTILAALLTLVTLPALGAPPAWRTPPIKNATASETVSCDLLNVSGKAISISNLVIQVRGLDGGSPSVVVDMPGPISIADGQGIRGSTPVGVMAYRTVYCEVANPASLGIADFGKVIFTMTFDDIGIKAVTVALPPK